MKNIKLNKDLISIIVPIYNVEDYLSQCVESILQQTYTPLEIILIDDGSIDSSGNICDDLSKKDKRIKVIHQKNKGLSGARNTGIEHSNGEYISFIDSDDFVEPDFIEFLYNNLINNDVEISACGMCDFYNNDYVINKHFKNIKKKYNMEQSHIYLNVLGYFDVAACNKLYKKDLFSDLRFPLGKTCEDWRVMYKLIDKINFLYYDSTVKYYYRQRKNSITKSNKIRYDGIEAANDAIEFYKIKGYNFALPYAYQSLLIAQLGVYNNYLRLGKELDCQKIYKASLEINKKLTYRKLKINKKIQILIYLYLNSVYNFIFKLKFNK